MSIMTVDPGGTSGWAVAQAKLWVAGKRSSALRGSGQVRGLEFEQVHELLRLICEWDVSSVIIEDFILQKFGSQRSLLSPVRIGSALAYTLWERSPSISVHWQLPSVMAIATDARLERWGILRRPVSAWPHANDAIRHMEVAVRNLR